MNKFAFLIFLVPFHLVAAILGSDNPEGEFNKFESGITFNSLKSLATIPEELRAKSSDHVCYGGKSNTCDFLS